MYGQKTKRTEVNSEYRGKFHQSPETKKKKNSIRDARTPQPREIFSTP